MLPPKDFRLRCLTEEVFLINRMHKFFPASVDGAYALAYRFPAAWITKPFISR
ncbi:hypothetical protein ES708_08216 [subsurface metagenome]